VRNFFGIYRSSQRQTPFVYTPQWFPEAYGIIAPGFSMVRLPSL